MSTKIIFLYFLIVIISAVSGCRYLFSPCGGNHGDCCKSLYCTSSDFCAWNGNLYVGNTQIAHGK
uniref:SP13 phlebotomine family member n=1 Tax=Nyssomyia intermedia TaxID=182990 RepID=J7HBT6_9DIPT